MPRPSESVPTRPPPTSGSRTHRDDRRGNVTEHGGFPQSAGRFEATKFGRFTRRQQRSLTTVESVDFSSAWCSSETCELAPFVSRGSRSACVHRPRCSLGRPVKEGGAGRRDVSSSPARGSPPLSFWLSPRRCPSEERDGTAQIAGDHVAVALRDGEVGASCEKLDGPRRRSKPSELGTSRFPATSMGVRSVPGALSRAGIIVFGQAVTRPGMPGPCHLVGRRVRRQHGVGRDRRGGHRHRQSFSDGAVAARSGVSPRLQRSRNFDEEWEPKPRGR